MGDEVRHRAAAGQSIRRAGLLRSRRRVRGPRGDHCRLQSAHRAHARVRHHALHHARRVAGASGRRHPLGNPGCARRADESNDDADAAAASKSGLGGLHRAEEGLRRARDPGRGRDDRHGRQDAHRAPPEEPLGEDALRDRPVRHRRRSSDCVRRPVQLHGHAGQSAPAESDDAADGWPGRSLDARQALRRVGRDLRHDEVCGRRPVCRADARSPRHGRDRRHGARTRSGQHREGRRARRGRLAADDAVRRRALLQSAGGAHVHACAYDLEGRVLPG